MPQEVKDMLLHYYMRYGGPIGLTEMDDMENWSYAQKASKGVIARRYPHHYAMGLGHETKGHHNLAELGLPQNALISEVMSPETRRLCSEQNSRGAYYFWADLMDSGSWDQMRKKGLFP